MMTPIFNPLEPQGGTARQAWTPLLDALPQGVMLVDSEGRYLEVNPASAEILGLERETLLSCSLADTWANLSAADGSVLAVEEFPGLMVIRTGTPVRRRTLGWNREDGSTLWLKVSAEPLQGGGALVSFDQMNEHPSQSRKLERQAELYSALSQVNQAIVWSPTREALLDKMCQVMVEFGKFKLAWIGWDDPETHEVKIISQYGDTHGYLQGLQVRSDDTPLGRGGIGIAIREGRTYVINDFLGAPEVFPWHESAIRSGFAASASIPIRYGGKVCGALTVYAAEKNFFGSQEIGLLEEAAGDVAYSLDMHDLQARRKEAEEALKVSEFFFRESQRAAAIGSYKTDFIEGKWESSEVLDSIFGIARSYDRSIQGWLDIVHPDDQAMMNQYLRDEVIAGRKAFSKEYRIIRRMDGETRWVHGRGEINFDGDGHALSLIGTIQDITERRKSEIALTESEEHFRSSIQNAQAGYFSIDLNGRFLSVNNAWLLMHGYDSPNDVIGQHFSLTQVERDLAQAETVIRQLSEGISIRHGTFSRQRKDGTVGYHTFSAWPVKHSGQIAYFEGFIIDETDRVQAEAALRENEHKFRAFFENLVEGAALHELVRDENGEIRDYRILDVNPAFQMHTGIDPALARGHLASEVYGTSVPPFLEAYSMVALEGTPLAFETFFPPLEKYFQISVISPTCGQFATLFEDITERKQREVALLDTTQRLKLATASAKSGVWDWNVQSGCMTWDERMFELYGATEGEIQGTVQDWKNGLHPEDLERAIRECEATLRGEAPFDTEFRVKHKDGVIRWIKANAIVLRDENSVPMRMIGLNRDITEQKQMENALRESEERYRNLFDRASVGILVISPSGIVRDVNLAFAQMHGYTIPEILAMHLDDFNSPETSILASERISRLFAGEAMTFQVDHLHRDGHVFPVEVSASPIQLNGDIFILGYNSDITERKAAEAKIRRMNEELEQRVKERTVQLEAANKEMEAFSYSVSHDLRTPLRSIDGFSRVLMEDYQDKLDVNGKHFLSRIQLGAQRMGHLIDDLLKLSKTSRSELTVVDCDLSNLCSRVAADLADLNPERRVEVTIQPGMSVQADHHLMQVVLENLLGNAWKYTSKCQAPRIEVGEVVSLAGERTFFIRDNGAGFAMAFAHKLFNAFQRLHATSEFEGTGIGLAISQRIIHRHGGRIWAEAEPEKGATFFFTIPG